MPEMDFYQTPEGRQSLPIPTALDDIDEIEHDTRRAAEYLVGAVLGAMAMAVIAALAIWWGIVP